MTRTKITHISPEARAEASRLHIVMKAREILMQQLVENRNEPGKKQDEALTVLLRLYSRVSLGLDRGRFAFPLPTGYGKTTSIVAWCAAIHQLGVTDFSVAIAASKVEDLCRLKRELIRVGGEGMAEKVGLIHSFQYDPQAVEEANRPGQTLREGFASEPKTDDNESRQFMLVTHNRVKQGDSALKAFNVFDGQPRSLLVWDEALLPSDVKAENLDLVKVDAAAIMALCEGKEEYKALYDWTKELDRRIRAVLDLRNPQGEVVELPSATEEDRRRFIRQFPRRRDCSTLETLIAMGDGTVRVFPCEGGGGIVSYQIDVPRELDRIVILDASYPVRALLKADTSIREVWDLPAFARNAKSLGIDRGEKKGSADNLKQYPTLRIRHMVAGGGRSAVTDDFDKPKAERRLARDIVHLVSEGIPQDEAVLIFVYKHRGRGRPMRDVLMEDLKDAGVDLAGTVQVDGKALRRINIATWGSETSTNEWSHCKHVILAGVLRHPNEVLFGRYLSAKDDLKAELPVDKLATFVATETAHLIYQAASRGACRSTVAEVAKPMNLYFVHPFLNVKPHLQEVMPGAVWSRWSGDYSAETEGKIEKLAQMIAEFLAETDGSDISCRRVKQELSLDGVPPRTFAEATKLAPEFAAGWYRRGQSFTRQRPPIAADFGFADESSAPEPLAA